MATELPRQLNMAIDGDEVTLANCPPGPFLFNEILGFKTEYGAMSGKDVGGGKVEWEVSGGPDAYVMDSGETFWGGAITKADRSALIVNPVELYFQDMPAPAEQMVGSEDWAATWHQTVQTMCTIIGISGSGSPEEILSELQAKTSAPHVVVTTEPTHRHKKRGSTYALIGIGKMQAENWGKRHEGVGYSSVDMREVAIYRSIDEGSLWVRPREEFEDGRFEALSAPEAEG